MPQGYDISSTPEERFDEWWHEEHGDTSIDVDIDEVADTDSFNDPESY